VRRGGLGISRGQILLSILCYIHRGEREGELEATGSFKVEYGDCDDRACLPDAALCIVGGVQVSELVVLVFDFVLPAAEKARNHIL
jgi:hypothetical protein